MIPRALKDFVDAFSEYGTLTLDVQKVLADPAGLLYKIASALPNLIELHEDHYFQLIENLKLGDVIDELES